MILPEHREAMIDQRVSLQKKKRAVMDDHKLDELTYQINEATEHGNEVSITVFGDFADHSYRGKIVKIDGTRIKLLMSDDAFKWINVFDIVKIY